MTTFYSPHQYNTRSRYNQSIRLKEYHIKDLLGEGAFSKVYEAIHVPTNQRRALKKVKLDDLDDKYKKLCHTEVQLLQKINSNNVLKCYSAFVHNHNAKSTLYVVLELVDGMDLEQRIMSFRERGSIFSERTIWFFFQQMCNGIKDLHFKRILHRDLKPANIFINSRSIIKIGDLGLSRFFSARTLAAHTRVGTEYYMSPERNTTGGYFFKSDIWSLGCLLYEMCTFRNPFNGEISNAYALHKKIATGDTLPYPMDVYSLHLKHFVKSCLTTTPEERPDVAQCYEASRTMYMYFEENLRTYNLKNQHS